VRVEEARDEEVVAEGQVVLLEEFYVCVKRE
jgi:hypothetical protein